MSASDASPTEGSADERLIAVYQGQPLSHVNKSMYRAWHHRRFELQVCARCGRGQHPPAPMCASCWSFELALRPFSGRGLIHLLVLLHQGPSTPGIDYSAGPVPVATVSLEEQPDLRLSGIVVTDRPRDVRIGMPVELTWIDRAGASIPAFRTVWP